MLASDLLVQTVSTETPWVPVRDLRVGDVLRDPVFAGRSRVAHIQKLAPAQGQAAQPDNRIVRIRAGQYDDRRPFDDVTLAGREELFVLLRRGDGQPVIDTVRVDSFVSTGVAAYHDRSETEFYEVQTDHGSAICVNGLALATTRFNGTLDAILRNRVDAHLLAT